jgi:hypothetical protein
LVPEYKNTLDISLELPMKNNNRWVMLGTRVHLLSDIFIDPQTLRQTDPVFDLYTAVSITKQFDLQINLNNINRNWNYGQTELHDFNVTSSLIWYFLN